MFGKTAIDDLATIDAHSATMARSTRCNVSDRVKGGVITKSVRAFVSIVVANPVNCPAEQIDEAEFAGRFAHMGRRDVKRRLAEVAEDEDPDDGDAPQAPRRAQLQGVRERIHAIGSEYKCHPVGLPALPDLDFQRDR